MLAQGRGTSIASPTSTAFIHLVIHLATWPPAHPSAKNWEDLPFVSMTDRSYQENKMVVYHSLPYESAISKHSRSQFLLPSPIDRLRGYICFHFR